MRTPDLAQAPPFDTASRRTEGSPLLPSPAPAPSAAGPLETLGAASPDASKAPRRAGCVGMRAAPPTPRSPDVLLDAPGRGQPREARLGLRSGQAAPRRQDGAQLALHILGHVLGVAADVQVPRALLLHTPRAPWSDERRTYI